MSSNRFLKSYSEQIQKEVWALSGSIENLQGRDLSKEEYVEYQKHINWVQNLFDESSELIKNLDLSQDNPTLYDDLIAKREISVSFNLFSKIRSTFWKRYRERDEREFERERIFEPPKEIVEEEADTDWLEAHNAALEQQALEEEEAFMAFMAQLEAEAAEADAKKAKADKKKVQQKQMADEAQKRQEATAAFYEKQRELVREEARQIPEQHEIFEKTSLDPGREEPSSSDTLQSFHDTYQEQYSSNEKNEYTVPLKYDTYEEQHKRDFYQKEQDTYTEQLHREQEHAERIQRESETMDAHRRKMDAVENYESIQGSHNDMSSDELRKAFHGEENTPEYPEEYAEIPNQSPKFNDANQSNIPPSQEHFSEPYYTDQYKNTYTTDEELQFHERKKYEESFLQEQQKTVPPPDSFTEFSRVTYQDNAIYDTADKQSDWYLEPHFEQRPDYEIHKPLDEDYKPYDINDRQQDTNYSSSDTNYKPYDTEILHTKEQGHILEQQFQNKYHDYELEYAHVQKHDNEHVTEHVQEHRYEHVHKYEQESNYHYDYKTPQYEQQQNYQDKYKHDPLNLNAETQFVPEKFIDTNAKNEPNYERFYEQEQFQKQQAIEYEQHKTDANQHDTELFHIEPKPEKPSEYLHNKEYEKYLEFTQYKEPPISFEEHYRQTHGGIITPEVMAAYESIKKSGFEADNERLYNHLYYETEHGSITDPVYVSRQYDALLYHNVETARDDYLAKKGTIEEAAAKEYYDKQCIAYNIYQNSVDRGSVHVDDHRAQDKPWLVPIKPKEPEIFKYEFPKSPEYEPAYQTEYYRYVPGGVIAETLQHSVIDTAKTNDIARDNVQLLSAITEQYNNPQNNHRIEVSPQIDTLMQYNLEAAKQNVANARGTAEEKEAIHTYLEQRNAYAEYHRQVSRGEILLSKPEQFHKVDYSQIPYNVLSKPEESVFQIHSYVPGGVATNTLRDNIVISNIIQSNHAERNNMLYTKEHPLIVTPEYDKAMQAHVDSVLNVNNIWLNYSKHDLKIGPKSNTELIHNASVLGALELKLATDAHLEYQLAKKEGRVIVSEKGTESVPDLGYWQALRNNKNEKSFINDILRNAKDNQAPLGSTLHSKRVHDNTINSNAEKAAVENINRGLFGQQSLLKYRDESPRAFHGSTQTSMYMLRTVRRKMYSIVQSDETGTFGEFEALRQYSMPVRQFASAQGKSMFYNSAIVGHRGRSHEAALFGDKRNLTDAELKTLIRNGKKQSSIRKTEIKELMSKGSLLDAGDRSKLTVLLSEHAVSNKDLKKNIALLEHRQISAEQLALVKSLEDKKIFGIKSQKVLHELHRNTIQEHNRKVAKKFGKLSTATNKSLQKEIQATMANAKELKAKIKLLEAKGSALSPAERKELLSLKEAHSKLSQKLKKLFGVKGANEELKRKLAVISGAEKIVGGRLQALKQGAYTLNSVLTRSLRQSNDAGLIGVAKAAELSSNYYVRQVAKKSVLGTLKAAKFVADKTGVTAAAKWAGHKVAASAPVQATKKAVMIPIDGTKKVIHKQTKLLGKLRTKTINAIKSRIPQPIKTGMHALKTAASKALQPVNLAWKRLKDRVSNSFIGNIYRALNKYRIKSMQAASKTLGLAKTLIIKVVLGILIFYVVVGILMMFLTLLSSPMIMIMDDPVNIKDYTELCQSWKSQFDKEVEKEVDDLKIYVKDKQVNNVQIIYVNGNADNTKEIISMAAVYLSQDFSDRAEAKKYMEGLHDDSHSYNVVKTDLSYCEGCYCPGNHPYCPGHTRTHIDEDGNKTTSRYHHSGGCKTKKCAGQNCSCDGHQNYDVNVTIHTFDTIFEHDSQANVGRDLIVDKDDLLGYYTITAYCGCEKCCGKTDGITASGTKATEGRTIAVDPNDIPYGTTVWINGNAYVAEDCGGAIDGKEIDMYFKSHKKALEWGVKTYPVYSSKLNNSGDDGKDYTFDGWYDANREWAKRLYDMDWKELYDVDFIAGGVLTPDFDAFFIPEDEAKGLTRDQLQMVDVATHSGSRGIPAQAGYCQKWVKLVYQAATGKTSTGAASANIAGRMWAVSANWDDIPVGAAVYGYGRTPSTNPYGHVGIYIGNGTVLHNVGGVASDTLDEWVSKYNGYGWGWQNGDSLQN